MQLDTVPFIYNIMFPFPEERIKYDIVSFKYDTEIHSL